MAHFEALYDSRPVRRTRNPVHPLKVAQDFAARWCAQCPPSLPIDAAAKHAGGPIPHADIHAAAMGAGGATRIAFDTPGIRLGFKPGARAPTPNRKNGRIPIELLVRLGAHFVVARSVSFGKEKGIGDAVREARRHAGVTAPIIFRREHLKVVGITARAPIRGDQAVAIAVGAGIRWAGINRQRSPADIGRAVKVPIVVLRVVVVACGSRLLVEIILLQKGQQMN